PTTSYLQHELAPIRVRACGRRDLLLGGGARNNGGTYRPTVGGSRSRALRSGQQPGSAARVSGSGTARTWRRTSTRSGTTRHHIHLPRLSPTMSPAAARALVWWVTVGWDLPRGSSRSHEHRSPLEAMRLRSRRRTGSARAAKVRASCSASPGAGGGGGGGGTVLVWGVGGG